jgi:nicotinate-nucleotide adenylyltransferase
VHLGHLLVAQAAIEELRLDRLFIVPVTQSPFKPQCQPAPAAVRRQMLRQAFVGQNQVEIDDQELRRGGVSYTIDTLRNYRQRFPGAELFYLIGTDHLDQLPKWREAEELSRLAMFVAIPRPGKTFDAFPAPFRGMALAGFPLALSSSQIRSRIRDGKPIDRLVPAAVAETLHNSKLYRP